MWAQIGRVQIHLDREALLNALNILLKLFEDRQVTTSVQLQSKFKSGGTSSGGNTVVQTIDLGTEEFDNDDATTTNRISAGAKFISGHLSSRRC